MRRTIYRNIQYKPRIWGLYFTSLFSALGMFLAVLMILSFSISIFPALLLSILFLGSLYGYLFFKDNRDEVEYSAKRSAVFKNSISSYSASEQKFRITE